MRHWRNIKPSHAQRLVLSGRKKNGIELSTHSSNHIISFGYTAVKSQPTAAAKKTPKVAVKKQKFLFFASQYMHGYSFGW